ncbi:MAG: 16S rRNA (guanine(527)-N(7))-methyltransferase RsmG [Clostridiales bacterium]|jgi:16S rRNA (guanine527-N7)-methyltransferase|nr:16S rRNA (guanine(527)-N(7))-methyltransferase RsmG [Clostridiales bacterium]
MDDWHTTFGAAAPKLRAYAAMLSERAKEMNLTAITDPRDVFVKHFADSATLLPLLAELFPGVVRLIDVGTGAGFPGLALKLMNPAINVTLLDSRGKRLAFLDEVIAELGVSGARTLNARAEEAGRIRSHREKYDAAVARAVSGLAGLAELCLPFVRVGGVFIAMKGADDETSAGASAIRSLGGNLEKVVRVTLPKDVKGESAARSLVTVRKVRETGKEYPREYAKIAKNPL